MRKFLLVAAQATLAALVTADTTDTAAPEEAAPTLQSRIEDLERQLAGLD